MMMMNETGTIIDGRKHFDLTRPYEDTPISEHHVAQLPLRLLLESGSDDLLHERLR